MQRILLILALLLSANLVQADNRYLQVLDPAYYIQTHPDLRQFGSNHNQARDHWLRHGVNEGRDSAPWFSANSYCQRYQDVQQAVPHCLDKPAIVRHFLDHGIKQSRNASPKEAWVISLRSHHNRYFVNMHNGGPGREVTANGAHIGGDWERMTLHNLGEGCIRNGAQVALRSIGGYFWAGFPDGRIFADNFHLGGWQTFTLTKHTNPNACLNNNDSISLKSAHNKYVVAEADGRALANRDTVGDWERFTVIVHGTTLPRRASPAELTRKDGPVVSLKTFHGPFLSNENNGGPSQPVAAKRPLGGDWERMKVIHHDAGCPRYGSTVSIKSMGGYFWAGFPDGRLLVDNQNIGGWHTFTLFKKQNPAECLAHGDKISLQSVHNKFVAAEADGRATANRDAAHDWETFSVVMGQDNTPQTNGTIDPVREMKKVAPAIGSFLDPLVGIISLSNAKGIELEQNQFFAVEGDVNLRSAQGRHVLSHMLRTIGQTGSTLLGLGDTVKMKAALTFANNEWDLSLAINIVDTFRMTGALAPIAEPKLAFKNADLVLHAKQPMNAAPTVSSELTGGLFFKPTARDPWLHINPTVELNNEMNLTVGGSIIGACGQQISATTVSSCTAAWNVFEMNMLEVRSGLLKLTLDPKAPSPHITGIETAIQDGLFNRVIRVDGALITDLDASPGFGLALKARGQDPKAILRALPLSYMQPSRGALGALDAASGVNYQLAGDVDIVIAPYAMSVGHHWYPRPTFHAKVAFTGNNITGKYNGYVEGNVLEAFKNGSIQAKRDISARATTVVTADFRAGLREALNRIPGMKIFADRVANSVDVQQVLIQEYKNDEGNHEARGMLRASVLGQNFKTDMPATSLMSQPNLSVALADAIARRFENWGAGLLTEILNMNPENAARLAQEIGKAYMQGAPDLGSAMGVASNRLRDAGVPVPDQLTSTANGVTDTMRSATGFANDVGGAVRDAICFGPWC